MNRYEIAVDTEKPCAECGKGGAVASGICLGCTAKAMNPEHAMRSTVGRAVQKRNQQMLRNGGTPMSEMTKIVKIKRKGLTQTEIHSQLDLAQGRGSRASILKCIDEPEDSFTKAMDALERPARELLQLIPEQWDGAMAVTGVTFTDGEEGEGVVITCQVALAVSEAPLVLNTPHLQISSVAQGLQKALEKVREEAQAYLDGKRKGDLFAKAA